MTSRRNRVAQMLEDRRKAVPAKPEPVTKWEEHLSALAYLAYPGFVYPGDSTNGVFDGCPHPEPKLIGQPWQASQKMQFLLRAQRFAKLIAEDLGADMKHGDNRITRNEAGDGVPGEVWMSLGTLGLEVIISLGYKHIVPGAFCLYRTKGKGSNYGQNQWAGYATLKDQHAFIETLRKLSLSLAR